MLDSPAAVESPASQTHDATRPMVLHTRVVTGAGGGPDKTILNSPAHLRALGYQAKCLFLHPPNDPQFQAIRDRSTLWDAPLVEVEDRGPLDWRVVPRITRLCRQLNVRVWHAHDYKTNLLGLLVRRRHAMSLVSTVHGWVEFTARTRLYYLVDRLTLPRYDRVVCVSPDLLERCRAMGVGESQSLLIENAIDCDQFRRRRTRAEAKHALGLPQDALLIGAVGRLSPEKGFDRLISAVALLRTTGIEPVLAILGDGGQRADLQAQIDQAGLGAQVRLVGFQSNTIDWYEAMDVFALSSLREGLPNVVLEAMAMETPVVATRVAGVPRLIEDGVSGVIVPIGDEAALVDALTRLLGDSRRRDELARGGRELIERRYSFTARMAKMAAVYESVGVPTGRPDGGGGR